MKKFLKGLVTILIVAVVAIAIGYVISCLTSEYSQIIPIKLELVFGTPTYITLALSGLFMLIFYLNKLTGEHFKNDKTVGSSRFGKTATGEKKEAYFSAKLITLKELKTNKDFHFCYFTTLKDNKFDGIPRRAERVGNKTEINMQKPIHTLVIGTTGSGKTTMLVDPTIQILAQCGSHPSMIMSDPKGELYAHNAQYLRNLGYLFWLFAENNYFLYKVFYLIQLLEYY